MNRLSQYTGDGNAYSIMGFVKKVLEATDRKDAFQDYYDQATSGDYNNLLDVSAEWSGFGFDNYYEGE